MPFLFSNCLSLFLFSPQWTLSWANTSLAEFLSLSFSLHSASSCAHSFFSSNQEGGRYKLIECGSGDNQKRLSKEQSQGSHNETLGEQGGLPIKSYYAVAMAPVNEWETRGHGGSIHGEQPKWVTRKRGVYIWDTEEQGGWHYLREEGGESRAWGSRERGVNIRVSCECVGDEIG